MEVSYRWLADFLDLEVTDEAVEEYAERLTQAGAEVESVERIGRPSRLTVERSPISNHTPTPTTCFWPASMMANRKYRR